MRFFGQLITAALAAASLAVPAAAGKTDMRRYPRKQGGGGKRCKPGTTILDLVFCASGDPETFDHRKQDYDILRELVIAANLVDAVAGLEDVTVFIPNDSAFERLAEALGYEADDGYDEGAIVAFLADAVSGLGDLEEVLTTIILYHVANEKYSFKSLKKGKTVTTLQEGTIDAVPSKKKSRVILKDKEPDLRNARIHDKYRDLKTSQGPVHIITRVLLPLDI